MKYYEIETDKLKANKGFHFYDMETQENLRFYNIENPKNVVRCHKIEDFDVLQFSDKEIAFEEAKKLQDKGINVSLIFRDNGNIYMQFLTKDELFLHHNQYFQVRSKL